MEDTTIKSTRINIKTFNLIMRLPINLLVLFSIGTILLFFFGPWMWPNTNNLLLAFFLISANLFILLGYYSGINVKLFNNKKLLPSNSILKQKRVIGNLRFFSIIAIIIALPDFLYVTRIYTLSLNQILLLLKTAITDPYVNYSFSLGYINTGSSIEKIFVILNVLSYFFRAAVLPISIVYWSRISKTQKFATVFLTLMEILKWLLKGMNKGLFDIVIIFIASILVIVASKSINLKPKTLKKNIKKAYRIFFVLVVLAVGMFTINSISRSGTEQINYYSSSANMQADPDNWMFIITPDFVHRSILSLSLYLTEGYYGLSLALELPFVSTFGFGNNIFMISNIRDYLGVDLWHRTYMYRVSVINDWDSLVNWHSLYTWFANDVSFVFVPLVMFVISFVFAKVWKDSVLYGNPYAVILNSYMFIIFMYISANNQVFSYAYTYIAFVITFILWISTRKKYI